MFLPTDFFDDGLPAPAQAYLKVCSAISEVGLADAKAAANLAGHPPQEPLPSPGATTVQKRSVLRTEEIVSPARSVEEMQPLHLSLTSFSSLYGAHKVLETGQKKKACSWPEQQTYTY